MDEEKKKTQRDKMNMVVLVWYKYRTVAKWTGDWGE
jgi:hypothetical protein